MASVRAGFVVLILGLLAFAGSGAAHGDDDSPTLTGTAILGVPGDLPVGALLTVTLSDVSRADAPAITLGQTQLEVSGPQERIPFALAYPGSAVQPQAVYAVQARVSVGERLLFTTTRHYPVDPRTPAPVTLELDAVSVPDVSLTDTYWKLLDVDGRHVEVTDVIREPQLVLNGQDGRFAGSGGVNRLMGGYTLQGGALSFSQVASTMMAGPPEAMRQEQAIVAALGKVRGFDVVGDRLTLVDESGTTLLEAVAVALR